MALNTRWWAIFQSREEAEWIYPHIARQRTDISEAERHREFTRSVQNLRRQQFYLYVKGHPAVDLRAPEVPDPGRGDATEELRAVFRREIASRSMVPAKVAAESIAKWEAEVVDGGGVPPPTASRKRESARGVDQLLRDLGLRK